MSKKKSVSEPSIISVRLGHPTKDGVAQAQLRTGSKNEAQRPLTDFSDAVQGRLRNAAVGTVVTCAPLDPMDIKKLAPTDPPPVAAPANAQIPRQAQQGTSRFDSNPYNFAAWEGDGPWLQKADTEASAEPTHATWNVSTTDSPRFSGRLRVTLTAQTPIFVPEGHVKPPPGTRDDTLRRFWRSIDAYGHERFGIPGSSIKGVVRTLFEILTNSRLSVVTEENFAKPIPYRRRSVSTWVVEAPSKPNGDRSVRKCEVVFAKVTPGGIFRRTPQGKPEAWTPPPGCVPRPNGLIDPALAATQVVPFLSNLLQTRNPGRHRWTDLYVTVSAQRMTIRKEDAERYVQGLNHSAYRDTLDHSEKNRQSGQPYGYDNIPAERRRLNASIAALADLSPGTLLFGIPDPQRPGFLACFGKNVNFLWPSLSSAGQLAGAFMPQSAKAMSLATADRTERMFGFAGVDSGDSHPFRGRVRFSTFWTEDGAQELESIRLKPLTSPAGMKLKSRSLYLTPSPSGRTPTYSEPATLRGRKLYWHQRAADGGVCNEHRGEGLAGATEASQLPPPIRPLAAGAVFTGIVCFDDLTDVELGALVASMSPDRLFDASGAYGLKVGKGKPRGLGSVTCRVEATFVDLLAAYATLKPSAELQDAARLTEAMAAYKRWAEAASGRSWSDIAFVKDLARLLRLPSEPLVRQYEPTPGNYGWLPELYRDNPGAAQAAALGDPAQGQPRPAPMKRARDY